MSGCKGCGGKGYIEHRVFRDAGEKSMLQQCCDISAYSNEVMRRARERANELDTDEAKARRELGHDTPGRVIPFKRREQNA